MSLRSSCQLAVINLLSIGLEFLFILCVFYIITQY